ncbi:MAG: UbiX family flavin prenyltransferase [Acidobacteriota bacterium]|nr:UbiX family flavin prenyltransferase [Acidobacteriota bacterium]
MRLLVGITGTTGVVYGIRLLEALAETPGVETHLVVTPAGERTIAIEASRTVGQVRALAHRAYRCDDIAAAPASGSFPIDGMAIAPCSMKTLSAIANSYADNLLTRAADVTLKERRPLVLLARETPLHAGHIENMLRVARLGGVILPPMPAFYHRPQTVGDIIDHTVGKALDLLHVEHRLFERWQGCDEGR